MPGDPAAADAAWSALTTAGYTPTTPPAEHGRPVALAEWRTAGLELTLEGCQHLHTAPAWVGLISAPGYLWCPQCAHEVNVAHRQVWTAGECDRCGTPGATEAKAWRVGPTVAVFGLLCHDCCRPEDGA
jgi:hypothetical protein